MRIPLFLLLCALNHAVLIDDACPRGWIATGDLCLKIFLEALNTNRAQEKCDEIYATLADWNDANKDDIIDLLESLYNKRLSESSWLLHPTKNGPRAVSRGKDNQYTTLDVPAAAAFPFLCQITPIGRKNHALQQLLVPNGAPKLIDQMPREMFFRPNGESLDFLPLPCRVSANPAADITWYRNDLPLDSNDSILLSGGTLLLPISSSLSYASFHCVASNVHGRVRSPAVVLKPAFIDHFESERSDVVPFAEGGARLDCHAPAHQPKSYSFTWLLGSTTNPVTVDERVFVSRDGSLLFSHVSPDDDASYSCSLSLDSTQSGHYGPFFRMRVGGAQAKFAPRFDPSQPLLLPNNPITGETVNVECFAYANPIASYRWERVDHRPFSSRVSIISFGRILRIENAQSEDAGRIRCSAVNALGAVQAELNIVLRPAAPSILVPLVDSIVAVDENFQLECPVGSIDRSSSVEWFRDGVPIVPLLMPPTQRKRFRVQNNKLIISATKTEDSGVYQCVIANEAGSATSSAYILVKNVSPVFPPQAMPSKIVALKGSNLSIPCTYQASPRGHSYWASNGGNRIPTRGRIRQRRGHMMIENVLPEDEGLFFCTARNREGRSHGAVRLVVIDQEISKSSDISCEVELACASAADCMIDSLTDRQLVKMRDRLRNRHGSRLSCSSVFGTAMPRTLPPAPVALKAENSTSGIRLSWRLPPQHRETREHQENSVNGYLVEMRTRRDRRWRPAPTNLISFSESDGFLLDELRPNSQYQFRVRSVDESSISEPSAPTAWLLTAPAPPKEAVSSIRWRSLDPNTLLVEWPPIDEEKLRYVVSWSEGTENEPSPSIFVDTLESAEPRALLKLRGKNGCRAVTLAVRAKNEYGRADVSTDTVAFVSSEGKLGRAILDDLIVLNATSAVAKWHWSGTSCGNSHAVTIRCLDSENDEVKVVAAGELGEWRVDGLLPSTNYTCTLRPFNALGHNGEESEPLTMTTKRKPPHFAPEITRLSLDQMDGDDRFTTVLEWTPVELPEDEDVGYKIYVYISETASDAVLLPMPIEKLSDRSSPSARIDGLRLMYLYTIQVAAYNSGGQGPLSAPRVIRLGASHQLPSSTSQNLLVLSMLMSCLFL